LFNHINNEEIKELKHFLKVNDLASSQINKSQNSYDPVAFKHANYISDTYYLIRNLTMEIKRLIKTQKFIPEKIINAIKEINENYNAKYESEYKDSYGYGKKMRMEDFWVDKTKDYFVKSLLYDENNQLIDIKFNKKSNFLKQIFLKIKTSLLEKLNLIKIFQENKQKMQIFQSNQINNLQISEEENQLKNQKKCEEISNKDFNACSTQFQYLEQTQNQKNKK